MNLYSTLRKNVEQFKPLDGNLVRMYSCGPTVYDHAHIGNLSSYIVADTLKRSLRAAGFEVEHVMNMTDVDDKTIARSIERYPDLEPRDALRKLTREYEDVFMKDMRAIGNDIDNIEFVRATDSIPEMQVLIAQLHDNGFAYIADDGVYFSIDAYKKSGKKYGQLVHIDVDSTSQARIANDEYDKESAHDFALWKKAKKGEPSWHFKLGDVELDGRPGWHIECSAMSAMKLTQPFDIHTGGVDLMFPHHENEIAQSTASREDPIYANFFVHSEHLLIDGKKMSKSLNNFYTLEDITAKGFDPLAFRLMILQSHYRKQANFTWEGLQAAQNRLKELQNWSTLRYQTKEVSDAADYSTLDTAIQQQLANDMNTPQALAAFSGSVSEDEVITHTDQASLTHLIQELDAIFGLQLEKQTDISEPQKQLLKERQTARDSKDWAQADELRTTLKSQDIEIKDTPSGQIWNKI